ncbi:MAG: low molecular weight phosphotyrosine protein phosphatase [Bacteroidota bacterium]|nr:low molecular weight phosphotyrosine protein phosphatase [Bacteroidota bacterium]
MKILMVCLGNICRSPMAEGILRDKVEKTGLDWLVDSAGTLGRNEGCQPHQFSQKVAKQYNIDICQHKCRYFTREDMKNFDKIYVMDDENYLDVKRISGNTWDSGKVDLILNELYPGEDQIVPDPWYGGEEGFHKVYAILDQACDAIIKKYASPMHSV